MLPQLKTRSRPAPPARPARPGADQTLQRPRRSPAPQKTTNTSPRRCSRSSRRTPAPPWQPARPANWPGSRPHRSTHHTRTTEHSHVRTFAHPPLVFTNTTQVLDFQAVTAEQRAAASALFTSRRIVKPFGFGSRVLPFERVPPVKGKPSMAEALLAEEVRSSNY